MLRGTIRVSSACMLQVPTVKQAQSKISKPHTGDLLGIYRENRKETGSYDSISELYVVTLANLSLAASIDLIIIVARIILPTNNSIPRIIIFVNLP